MLKRAYGGLLKRLPPKASGRLARLAFAARGKPSFGSPPPRGFEFPGGAKGCVVFSADVELAWAWRFAKGYEKSWREMARRDREQLPELLSLFDARGIPATWAAVGHLFLSSCSRHGNSRAHPEMERPPHFENEVWRFDTGDWYQHDPCGEGRDVQLFYAPDLLSLILASGVGHEIACHSFSHADFTDRNCPEPVAEAEVAACLRVASENGLALRSFVFPAGTYGHIGTLAKFGFTNYRRKGRCDVAFPELDMQGLVVLPSSTGLDDSGFGWSDRYQLQRLGAYLDRATKHRLVCHFWFHPSMEQCFLENVMPRLLDEVRERVEKKELWVATMAQCADYCRPWLPPEARNAR